MLGLIDTGIVYTPDPATGAYTVVARTGLACRLVQQGMSTDMGPARAEKAPGPKLLWDASYVMPESAQLEISGVRWNVEPGTLYAPRLPDGTVYYRAAQVVRAA